MREKALCYRIFRDVPSAAIAARGGAALTPFTYAREAATRDRSYATKLCTPLPGSLVQSQSKLPRSKLLS
jgi:hypothetical protein